MTHRTTFILTLAIVSNLILAIILPRIEHWETEPTRIAASIATGQGFSSPFRLPTGPSAWIPPVYPYLLAGVFRIFGVFSAASYWAAIAINIAIHALTCVVLYQVSAEVWDPTVGWYAACALGSFPLLFYPLVFLHVLTGYAGVGLFISPNILWYTHFAELAMVCLIWLTLHPPHWISYGAAWGLASLLNPTALAVAPAFLGWLWIRRKPRYVLLAAVVWAGCIAPWVLRNYLVFHRLLFIRDNFGVELRVGNRPGNHGLWSAELHPDRSEYELNRVVEVGEADYTRLATQEALHIIRAQPGEFVRDTFRRVGYWWTGNPVESQRLGKWKYLRHLPPLILSVLAFIGIGRGVQRNPKSLLFAAVLLFYPLIYYITHTFYQFFYQYPIHPEMFALATFALTGSHVARRPLSLDSLQDQAIETNA